MNSFKPIPETLVETRLALHRLATYVIAPARYRVTERFGLRATRGGFGTPEFEGRRIRVEGLNLIDERNGEEKVSQITTLSAASEFLGEPVDGETAAEHDSPKLGDLNGDLAIDEATSLWLGDWFNAAFAGLSAVGADAESVDASEPQLWPGHFDPAIEVGDEPHRGSYGASPGDHNIAEPYLYLGIWSPDGLDIDLEDGFWNASAFKGALMKVSDFPRDEDPVEVAASFWRTTRDRLNAASVI